MKSYTNLLYSVHWFKWKQHWLAGVCCVPGVASIFTCVKLVNSDMMLRQAALSRRRDQWSDDDTGGSSHSETEWSVDDDMMREAAQHGPAWCVSAPVTVPTLPAHTDCHITVALWTSSS